MLQNRLLKHTGPWRHLGSVEVKRYPTIRASPRPYCYAKMTRGEGSLSKVHCKGKFDDYIVFVSDVEAYKTWLNDKSVPLARFVSPFSVFVTHR